jgi:hypothetical protein
MRRKADDTAFFDLACAGKFATIREAKAAGAGGSTTAEGVGGRIGRGRQRIRGYRRQRMASIVAADRAAPRERALQSRGCAARRAFRAIGRVK